VPFHSEHQEKKLDYLELEFQQQKANTITICDLCLDRAELDQIRLIRALSELKELIMFHLNNTTASCLWAAPRYCRAESNTGSEYMSSDQQPLLSDSPHSSPPSRKRRNTASGSLTKHSSRAPYEKPKPVKLKIAPIPDSNRHVSPLNQLSSPGSVVDQNLKVAEWLSKHQDQDPFSIPPTSEIINSPNPDKELKKFVMIQVFERDTLLKNDLIPLSDTDNTEICISYIRQESIHHDTNNFRAFQISSPFKRQFGKGLRLFCKKGEIVQLMKSTHLMTFYGTKATPDWEEIKHESKWENIFDFRKIKPSRKDKDFDFGSYNKKTACVDNAVRVTVGCEPNTKHIYETEFHIKLSFIVH